MVPLANARDAIARRSASSNQCDAIGVENRRQFRASDKFAAGASRELWDSSVVNGEVVVAVQSGGIPNAIELAGVLIDGKAGPLTKPMRPGAHGIGRHAEGDGIATTQINQVKAGLDGEVDMDKVVQIVGAEDQRARISIPQVTDDGFEKRDLE